MSKNKDEGAPSENFEFDWLQLRKDLDSSDFQEETTKEKFVRKFQETPLVPIGVFATSCFLLYGLWAMRHGRSRTSQLMMRGRILAQGFTIAAVVAGFGYSVVDK